MKQIVFIQILMRAIRYSSTLFAFNEEQLLIKLMLLYNELFSNFCFFPFSLTVIHRGTSILDSTNFLPTNYQ
jgi:hypothetical protein